jgi:hypothetical protein
MCDSTLRAYVSPGIYALAKQVIESCLTCRKVNKLALRGQGPGGRSPGLRLFQSIQVDYTELPLVGHLNYLLVIVEHLTNWAEAMPLSSAAAKGVVKVLLDNKIPTFGVVENIDSVNRNHFTANIIKELAKALSFKWLYHTT